MSATTPPAARFYDARGNIYGVIAPAALQAIGLYATDARSAAATAAGWAAAAIHACCSWPDAPPPGAKPHRSDGLLVGPFQASPPFDVLILNTDGTLAERSGNGLTIFATDLAAAGLAPGGPFGLRVHHAGGDPNPTHVLVEAAREAGVAGFWLALGQPGFGPEAVGAGPGGMLPHPGQASVTVPALAAVDPRWTRTVPVRIGNPHAVTFLPRGDDLPAMEALRRPPLLTALTAIAYAASSEGSGNPCPAGINLQWAALRPDGDLSARIFERGEGPTESSGTSATAVACAARRLGLVKAARVLVHMPGGVAPLDFAADGSVRLFGAATPLPRA